MALLFAVGPGAAQRPVGAKIPTIRTTAGEVLFDMVVTDRQNRIVKDLKPGEVEIFDNGAPQRLVSFQLVAHSSTVRDLRSTASAPAHAVNSAGAEVRQVNLVMLVFDHMNQTAAIEARRGAESFVRRGLDAGDYAAVYRLDLGAYVLQGFTADKTAVLNAIQLATGHSALRFSGLMQLPAGSTTPVLDEPASSDSRSSDPAFAAMDAQAKEFSERQERADAARGTLEGLLGIVHSLARFSGRKTVLYFSQWLPVDLATIHLLQAVIADANQANVSFYTIDPSGLNEISDNSEAVGRMNRAAAISRTEADDGPVSTTQANLADSIENIQYTSRRRMDDLAHGTGGLYIADTNDLAPRLRAVADDMTAHYELSWTPSSGWDGKYHTIQVKLKRAGLSVRARPGYKALTTPAGGLDAPALARPAAAFEAPLYALFDQTPAPAGLALEQSSLVYPADPENPTVSILLDVPLADLGCGPLPTGGRSCPFAVLALVKDRQGAVVGKWSQDVPLSLAPDQHPRDFLFERDAELPPGLYHLEGAIYQGLDRKGAARRSLLYVPPSGGLRLSSIAVLAGVQPLSAAEAGTPNPLHYAGQRLIPAVGESLPASAGKVTLFFVVYPPPGSQPEMSVEFSRGGVPVARASQPLPAPDADGRVVMTPAFALDRFAPGEYEADVRVTVGAASVSRAAHFVVVARP